MKFIPILMFIVLVAVLGCTERSQSAEAVLVPPSHMMGDEHPDEGVVLNPNANVKFVLRPLNSKAFYGYWLPGRNAMYVDPTYDDGRTISTSIHEFCHYVMHAAYHDKQYDADELKQLADLLYHCLLQINDKSNSFSCISTETVEHFYVGPIDPDSPDNIIPCAHGCSH